MAAPPPPSSSPSSAPSSTPSSAPLLSIVTVTHGRRTLLLEKAETLRRQTLPPQRFEWRVLANDAPDSAAALDALELPFAVTVRRSERNLPIPAARNRAAAGARGRWLLLSDDDCLLAPGCLRAHLDAQQRAARRWPRSGGAVVVGPLRLPEALRVGRRREPFEAPPRLAGRALWINATGANTSLPRGAFEALGGYDESFRDYGGEDPELALRLRAHGLRFRAAPAALAFHAGRALDGDGERKAFLAGRAHARIYRRHPTLEVGLMLGVHPWLLRGKRRLFASALASRIEPARLAYERAYAAGATGELAATPPPTPTPSSHEVPHE